MSASLVGSEMCIRDSPLAPPPALVHFRSSHGRLTDHFPCAPSQAGWDRELSTREFETLEDGMGSHSM
eukprot:5082620-Alexandrium_andersonii.AAC.1